jgi:hypothetical protein
MKQPYIYTMPEEFLKDEAVPARWKVLATVQGFWISGKTLYATNEWIQKKLGYSRRQIQYALSELEKMNLITRNVHGMNRLILPGGAIRLHGGVQSDDQKSAVGLHHNSVSNSESIISASRKKKNMKIRGYDESNPSEDLPSFDVNSGAPTAPPSPASHAKYPHAKLVFALFPKPEPSWKINTTELKHAELLYARGMDKVGAALRFVDNYKGEEYCPTVTKPSDLERKWNDLLLFKKKHGY